MRLWLTYENAWIDFTVIDPILAAATVETGTLLVRTVSRLRAPCAARLVCEGVGHPFIMEPGTNAPQRLTLPPGALLSEALTYSLYPDGRNDITPADASYTGTLANVSYGTPSSYGTYQGGNVFQWNDAIDGTQRGMRGGHWYFGTADYIASTSRVLSDPSGEDSSYGFRVVSVPEPAPVVLTMFASGALLIRRKR